ncbi:hypothetical protein D3C71_1794850 [compost metagenome]
MRLDFVPGRCVKPAGISSRQNATSFMRSEPSVMTTSLSASSPKPIRVGVEPVPLPNFTLGIGVWPES